MTDLDMMVFRMCSSLKDQGFALEAAKQEIAILKAKVQELEARNSASKTATKGK